jgi:phosphoribosylamine--glycine ligase
MAAAQGRLAEAAPLEWDDRAAVTVVYAAQGYPDEPLKGSVIRGLADAGAVEDVVIFHAGTRLDSDGALRADGGRALNITAIGSTLQDALTKAYTAVDRIDWPGGFCRRDIGWRALAK